MLFWICMVIVFTCVGFVAGCFWVGTNANEREEEAYNLGWFNGRQECSRKKRSTIKNLICLFLILSLFFLNSCGRTSDAKQTSEAIKEIKEINLLQKYLIESVEKLEGDVQTLPFTKALLKINPNLSTFDLLEINIAIGHASQITNIPPELILAFIKVESSANPNAKGLHGEIGLMQPLPSTARILQIDPSSNYENIVGCTQHIRYLLDKYNNDLKKTIAAYNGGEGNINKKLQNPNIKKYINNIMNEYAQQIWLATRKGIS